jgi:hypothetical protein
MRKPEEMRRNDKYLMRKPEENVHSTWIHETHMDPRNLSARWRR